MSDFRHVNATSLAHAEALLSAGAAQAKACAGGTDLLGTLKDRVHAEYPHVIVNLKTIPELCEITEDSEGLHIGALVTLSELERHPLVRDRYPLLAEATRAVAAPQLRAMGTIGGNICQEPRCWYYRAPDNTFPCTRKGGRHCNAFIGESRFHSVFGSAPIGTRPCTGVPQLTALLAHI